MSAPDYFPKTLVDAIRYFSDKETAFDFMVEMRWPEGVTCPHCGHLHVGFIKTRKIWRCEN